MTIRRLASHAWTTWPRAAAEAACSALAAAVFAFLDVADVLLCFVYAFLDGVLEDSPASCYCHRSFDDEEVSDTLYVRRSVCRDALTRLVRRIVRRRRRSGSASSAMNKPRWSDCGCASCVEWMRTSGGDAFARLHVAVREKEPAAPPKDEDAGGTESEDESAIFIHGFASSSCFWTDTVFRDDQLANSFSRLVAVDLLGFGRSPKPADCRYTLKDHVDAIERSVLVLTSPFHLVAHSMGCIIALALAARHPSRVKSITLLAPPYFPACECESESEQRTASQVALRRLTEKKLWPPLLFGSAVMTWYEHVGRTVCLVICKNHLFWEWLLINLLTLLTPLTGGKKKKKKTDVDFQWLRDLTRHTHHSGWHTMHNVVCGGATMQDRHLEVVEAAGIPVQLIHGVDDRVVPVACSRHLKAKLPRAELRILHGHNHSTVVFGREKEFAEELRAFVLSHSSS